MRLRFYMSGHDAGFSLLELLVVLSIMGICVAGSTAAGVGILRSNEAKGAAQTWQTAAAWAQVGVLWHGGSSHLRYDVGAYAVENDLGLCGGSLGCCAAPVPVTTNLPRWSTGDGADVTFAESGAPNGGGSLFFQAWRDAYRVVVRPESGLTTREMVAP